MSAFSFSPEATLYSNEYEIVQEMRKAWRADLDRFHQMLFAMIKPQLSDLQQKQTAGSYRYWWLKKWDSSTLKLWQPLHYPDLIRDSTFEFHAYLADDKKRENVDPILQTEASSALGSIRGVSVVAGNAGSDRPLTLQLRWRTDPLAESAQGLIEVMRALDAIVPALQVPTQGA